MRLLNLPWHAVGYPLKEEFGIAAVPDLDFLRVDIPRRPMLLSRIRARRNGIRFLFDFQHIECRLFMNF